MRRLQLGFACLTICLAILAIFSANKTQASASKKIEMYPASMTGFPSPTSFSPSPQKSKTPTLGGSNRYLTGISSDKPFYQVNEKVFIRGVVLNAITRKPLPENTSVTAAIQIKGPHGEQVAQGSATTQDSVWAFEWKVPETLAGGEYSLIATYPSTGYTFAERKFDVRAYREPRLSTQITFLRDGYGPGDKVIATIAVKRAEGGFPEGAKVTVNATVDGTTLNAESGKVDANGSCKISLKLPGKISRGEGTLALTVHDGEVIETASKTIPILLQTLDIQMFPEGGDLIAGYENRVYVQALQPNGKPADVVATVVSEPKEKQVVAQFHTEHEGRGTFQFIPRSKFHYSLKILKPSGITALFPLPSVKVQGAVIRADANVYKRGQPITVKVGCTQKKFRIVVSKRDQQLVSRSFDYSSSSKAKNGEQNLKSITLPLPVNTDGVLIVTVSGDKGSPLAERLIFREQAKPLRIQIKPDKAFYAPGDAVKLSIKTTDLENKPMASVVGITVTDETVLKMMDKRDRSLRLPVMMYLEPEVKDLADASVYLDPKNPKAPLAIDLLLGTQGWRRFALVDVNKFLRENGEKGRRALAVTEALRTVPAYSPAPYIRGFGKPAGASLLRGSLATPSHRWAAPVGDWIREMKAPDRSHVPRTEPGAKQTDDEPRRPSARWEFSPNVWKKEQAILPRGYDEPPAPFRADASYLRKAPAVRLINPRIHNAFRRIHPSNSLALYHNDFVVVREFAHQVKDGKLNDRDRNDFADTVYWNAGIKTDSNGAAEISFRLNDSVTTFQTFADAFSNSGSIGDANAALKSIRPFYVEPKLPLEVSTGDRILLPVNLINGTGSRLDGVSLSATVPSTLKLMPGTKQTQHLKPNERARVILPIEVGFKQEAADFTLNASAGSYHDKVVRPLRVVPGGFPVEKTFGGMLEPGKRVTLKISIEKNMVPTSMVSNIQILPTALAKLTAALERLIKDPGGCFEQTSSTTYPLTMAQQYFLTHADVDPKLIESSKEKLNVGYQLLLGYRCKDLGYECFGQDPGHEALTAYGLLHFTEMARVKDVDQTMIATTRDWLLHQKDNNGGFTRKRRSAHAWLEDKDCSNAYILWALLESGEPATNLQRELTALKASVASSQNNYVVALAANAFAIAGDRAEATMLMNRLAAHQSADGSVDGITASIVGSGGDALKIEGTSLATLAWLREPEYSGNVNKSIKFLTESCKNGRYSSTQATVLALRCIVDYDKQHSRVTAPGKVRLFADGHAIGDWIAFTSSAEEPIKLPDLSEVLSPGEHEIELAMDDGSPLPYTVGIKYNRLTPTSKDNCKVDLKVTLAQDKLLEGKSTAANVVITNTSNAAIPTPVAIIGLPGGLEPRHDQLKELVKLGKIASYEVRGREVVLYWRDMPANASFQIPISLIAVVPGNYTGPASRAYLYYSDEYKKWIDGLHVEIAAN